MGKFKRTDDGRSICPECGLTFHPNGVQSHLRITHRKDTRGGGGWNKGLTQNTDARVAKNTAGMVDGMRAFAASLSPEHRREFFRSKWKNAKNMGGIRKGSGRGKKGWCRGYWCDSTWELAWVLYNTDHKITFTRNTEGFSYAFEGETLKFYPDFKLENGGFTEIKGWLDAKNKAKIAQFPHKLTVLGKSEIQPVLRYVREIYGEDFVKMYDGGE